MTLIYTLSQYNLKDEAFSAAKLFLKTHPKSHIAHVALYKFYLDAKAYDKAIASMKIVTAMPVIAQNKSTEVNALEMNDIALVSFKLNKPIYLDEFKKHRTNGSFILIDTQSNNTAGVGFIQ